MNDIPALTKKEVVEVLASWTGIPIDRLDSNFAKEGNLNQLEEKLKSEIFGQSYAIDAACKALKRRFILSEASQNEMRLISTLMFVGSSGCGKTDLALQIADNCFGSEKNLIRIDCGNYSEEHSIAKLIGSPPGYVGYAEGGQLTNALRKKSYGVILFDEIEKANPKVITNILVQLASNGTVTDGNTGSLIDATNTILILTSNLGTSFENEHKKDIGFTSENINIKDEKREKILREIHNFLPNEIIGRIDEIIIFNELDEDSVKAIWKKEVKKLEEKLTGSSVIGKQLNEVQIEISELAEQIFISKAMTGIATQGARAVQRIFNRWITDQITEMKVEKSIPGNGSYKIVIDINDNEALTYTVVLQDQ